MSIKEAAEEKTNLKKEDFSAFKIASFELDERNKGIGEIFRLNTDFKGDDKAIFLGSMRALDQHIAKQCKELNKFSQEFVNLVFTDNDKSEKKLRVRLGEGSFDKGLDNLIALSNNDLKRSQTSKAAKENFVEEIEEIGNKNPTKQRRGEEYDKLNSFFNNSISITESLGNSIGDESLSAFLSNFRKTFQTINFNIKITPNAATNEKDQKVDDLVQTVLEKPKSILPGFAASKEIEAELQKAQKIVSKKVKAALPGFTISEEKQERSKIRSRSLEQER